MKQLLKKLIKGLAYGAAAVVIVLAVAVGIFRLMLPRLPEYQEEIKTWASNAIGMRVEFAGMNARWRLSGPELSFFDAGLGMIGSEADILTAGEVSIGVGLLRLVADRELVVDRVSIRNTQIDLRQDESGTWQVQGMPLDEIIGARSVPAAGGGEVEVVGQNIAVSYEHPESGQIVPMLLRSISVMRDPRELRVEADIDLPDEFGDSIEVSANQLVMDGVEDTWRLYAEADSLNLAGLSRLQPVGLPNIRSGTLDLSIWMDLAIGEVLSATANVDVEDLLADTEDTISPFSMQGSFEYSAELDGWLLAANQLRVSTADSTWPQSSFQIRVIEGPDGRMAGLRANSGYFNLDDIRYVRAWLPVGVRNQLSRYAPSGIMRGVSIELTDMGGDSAGFDLSADLEEAGIAATDGLAGIRNLSGSIRADSDGGRVEIESAGLSLDLGSHLAAPLGFDSVVGTVIWRRNQDGMIVLSDSVRIRNADLDSRMNLQVSIPGGGEAPFIDFESTWSVSDLSAMHKYLPVQLIQPNLRQWLTDAMVAGRIPRGTTQFIGSLDKFPFDDGDGVFRIEARLEDATLLYSPKWPAPRFNHLDLVVDKMRLYSEENSTVNLGNSVEDATIEIPDLRRPVLGIEAFATGTLETIRSYALQSPINSVLGGQLDRVEIEGDASFDLSIRYPIQDKENYDFSTRIRTSGGVIRVAGFPAPISELNGTVSITRNDVSSESLFGHFLGYPVNLQLSRIQEPDSPHSVILEATGQTTAEDLQSEFGMPLTGVLDGDTEYRATMRFPNAQAPQPGTLQVLVKSDLFGFQSNLPRPLDKSDDEVLPLALNIEFPAANQITTAGSLAGEVNWMARFVKLQDEWDFDRGVLAVGGDYPDDPNTRGLHIQGQAAEVDLHAWLAEGRRGNRETGLGDRIRTIDLNVDHFHAVGQLFTNHRLVVNRSGQDWVIQLSGEEVQGTVTVPYDFTGDRPMTLEMERLVLPGDDEEEGLEEEPLDPRSLPAISIRADEFAFGQRFFGRLEADFDRTDRGLESARLVTQDESFTVEGAAGWIIDAYEETGQRTYFEAVLKSSDVRRTSQRLNYDPGVSAGSMEIDLDVGWAGGPRDDFLSVLNGNVGVTLGAGRLTEVEPGAGRVFGLMSFVALPRRLALDFSDVFDTGFSFDLITGRFRITNGDAYTCDLTLTGPAADVGIVGRAGLSSRDYNQSVIVSANVGNTLPVVGLFTGGPQVAAALLVFSQLFKKPLKDMGQVYYAVEGSWDDPVIGNADSQHFAETSSLAGCLNSPSQ
jgi:uncharacterized protein (TIGR02099 family)